FAVTVRNRSCAGHHSNACNGAHQSCFQVHLVSPSFATLNMRHIFNTSGICHADPVNNQANHTIPQTTSKNWKKTVS
ncbi:MAG: hypothetical protein ACPGRD_08745, partial [Planktomarina sp.]